ncbi:hypothetical protein [Enterococcus faecium]|uniref:hypothetical protein n=1 Tax=Enterococcus faecium TaxID=1352 RepID=UPI00289171E1|nr:hypothetical protein [Enterococcus faecium]MDT2338704.1 hypothetical protein [Enterococcus faecium]
MKAKGVMLVLGCSLLFGLVINRSLAHEKKSKNSGEETESTMVENKNNAKAQTTVFDFPLGGSVAKF